MYIANLGFGPEFFQEVLSGNPLIQSLQPLQKSLKLKTHSKMILDYLCDIIEEGVFRDYINREGLDSSLKDFQTEIARRTQKLV